MRDIDANYTVGLCPSACPSVRLSVWLHVQSEFRHTYYSVSNRLLCVNDRRKKHSWL